MNWLKGLFGHRRPHSRGNEPYGESTFIEWHHEVSTHNRRRFHRAMDESAREVSLKNSPFWHISLRGCERMSTMDISYIITEVKKLNERGFKPIVLFYVSDNMIQLFGDLGRLEEYFIFRKATDNPRVVDIELRQEQDLPQAA